MNRGQKAPDPKKLEHYRATLDAMRDSYPDLPLLDELESELQVRDATRSRAPGPRPGARA
jgi:hypothetical protein